MASERGLIARYIRAVRGEAPSSGDGSQRARFFTISRQAGAGGRSVAEAIVKRMDAEGDRGWTLFDSRAFQEAVRAAGLVPTARLAEDEIYESAVGDWIEQVFGSSPQDAVMLAAFKSMRRLAERGRVVFVGRGAGCLLRDLGGVHLRLVGSLEARLAQLEQRYGVGRAEARKRLEEMDASRAEFFRDRLHRRIDDPELYDLVVNTDWVKPEQAAGLAVELYRLRIAARR